MEESFVLREGRVQDLDRLLHLVHQLSPPSDEEKGTGLEELRKVLLKIINDEHHHLYIFESAGEIVGTGTLLLQLNLAHGGRPSGHIENIVVDERHRKKGFGKRIIEHLVEKARERNCYKVILSCKKHNSPFYQRCDLRESGEIEMRREL